jgi:hypothetical protein
MITGEYIIITPTGDESGDGYKTAIIAVFENWKAIEEKKPIDAWTIDAFTIMPSPLIHCDFEPDGDGIRLWAVNYKLAADKCFGPSISVVK